jgi:DHA2 family multidrug resistance protein
VALFFLVTALIHEPHQASVRRAKGFSVDWLGFGLVGLSLGCLQIVLDRGQQEDWFGSPFIAGLALTSAVALVLLIWRELRHPHPMVDLRLMRDPDFAVSFVLMLMLGFMLLGSTYLVPAYVQSLMGYRAIDAGMVLTPGGLATMVMLPIVGRLTGKFDLRVLVGIGLILGGTSLLWMTHFYLGVSFEFILLTRIAQAAALPFLFIPVNAVAFRSIGPDKTNNASALVNLARNFGGSIGIAFASTLLARRAQFHQSRLVESLQGLNPAYPDYAQRLGGLLGTDGHARAALAGIYQEAVQQATLLAYLDDFKILALLFFGLVPLLLLVKPGKGIGQAGLGH